MNPKNTKHPFKVLLCAMLSAAILVAAAPAAYAAGQEAPEDKTIQVISLNVAGLPGILSSSDPTNNTKQISPLLNAYDIVSVQEDFAYHNALISQVTLPYLTPHSGTVPVGDGMNFMSKFPLYETTRYTWNDRHGFISDGADQMTPKGILYSSVEIEPGFFVDIYDLHADAGDDEGSYAARRSNMSQLGELIQARSKGKAVIVLGDTNSRYTRVQDNFETAVLEACGLNDPWIDLIRGGEVPQDGDALMNPEDRNSATNEVVDKIWYRSGKNVQLEAVNYALLESFVNDKGEQLSDHYPISATFRYTLNDTIKTSETFGGGGGSAFSFIEEMGEQLPDKISIRTGTRVDRVEFTYGDAVASVGGSGGTEKTLVMQEGEYITSMQVCKAKKTLTGTYRISFIKLTTNLGNVLEGGSFDGGNTQTFTAPEGYAIAGVHGFYGDEIDRMGAVYLLLG